jgi:3'-phosphoadenosine 5'-phosphosulfate sulfotransferase (PAPS reductase)/FAD synthetase
VVWSSGGKDSEAALAETVRLHAEQGVPLDRVVVAHNDLGDDVEWAGTRDLAARQAAHFALPFITVRRADGLLLIEHVERKGLWPDQKRRWCTSDHKRGPGLTALTALVRQITAGERWDRPVQLLQVYGFRAAESRGRAKKVAQPLVYSKQASSTATERMKLREVWDWYPLATWSDEQVWATIHAHGLPYHWAYARGMRRLSCTFCVMAGEEDLVTAARLQPLKAARYLRAEQRIGHRFKDDLSMADIVRRAGWTEQFLRRLLAGEVPPPLCPNCAADLHGTWPATAHAVPGDVAEAMFRRGDLVCNGRFYDDVTGAPATRGRELVKVCTR